MVEFNKQRTFYHQLYSEGSTYLTHSRSRKIYNIQKILNIILTACEKRPVYYYSSRHSTKPMLDDESKNKKLKTPLSYEIIYALIHQMFVYIMFSACNIAT